jgi:hypothetical protein
MDSTDVQIKLGSKCICDEQQGCSFDNWPENCNSRNGYGQEYFWSPGPEKTFTENSDFTSTIVEDDYSLTYLGKKNQEIREYFKLKLNWLSKAKKKREAKLRVKLFFQLLTRSFASRF